MAGFLDYLSFIEDRFLVKTELAICSLKEALKIRVLYYYLPLNKLSLYQDHV